MYKLSFVVLAVFALLQVGYGLQCFQCAELTVGPSGAVIEDKDCGDEFSSAKRMQCLNGHYCMKHKTPQVDDVPSKVTRFCGTKDDLTELSSSVDSFKGVLFACETDLCNSASATSTNFVLGVLFTAIHYLFLKYII